MAAATIGSVLVIAALAVELRREGGRIGACVCDATGLSQVSEFVLSELYGDTDQFLGKSPRKHEEEFREALANAYAAARKSASGCRAPLTSGAAARARDLPSGGAAA